VSPRPSRQLRRAAIAIVAASCLAATAAWIATGSASAGTLAGTLYRDPNSAVVKWVAANPNDSRVGPIRDKIASQPAAHWLANFNISTAASEASGIINAANGLNQVPVLSVYEITNRDCGGASAGGAPDLNQYQQWISAFSTGLGNRLVIIILETDALALQTCLSVPDGVNARDAAISQAVQTIKGANPNAKVYLDGGHSAWNSAGDQASRLVAAGVRFADGFFTNVSNFNSTAGEINYGNSIITALNNAGVTGKHQIIDTSRNGGAAGDWCADDNTDRRLGMYPTLNTGNANVDGFLWVKPPGEADGCKFTAGSFQPDLAFSLQQGVPNPGNTNPPPTTTTMSTPPSSTTTTTSRPPSSTTTTTSRPPSSTTTTTSRPPSSTTTTTTTSSPPPNGACSGTFRLVNSWPGGFQGEVAVKAGTAAINGWTVRWTLASGQSIVQLWNGAMTVSGSNVTVKNLDWNASLGANASTTFGFTANGAASTPTITCTSP
jgi:endoglucanase